VGDFSNDAISGKENQKFDVELQGERNLLKYKNILFYCLGLLIIVMFVVAFWFTYNYVFQFEPNIIKTCKDVNVTIDHKINETIKNGSISSAMLIGITLMIPTILSLALMRFLFGSKKDKEDKNVPSIVFNLGKETIEILQAFISKR